MLALETLPAPRINAGAGHWFREAEPARRFAAHYWWSML